MPMSKISRISEILMRCLRTRCVLVFSFTNCTLKLAQFYPAYCAAREPMEQLPLGLSVDHSLASRPYYQGPVKLLYGFATTIEDLLDYAKKVKILTELKLKATEDDAQDRKYLFCDCVRAVEKHLRWVTRARLKFRTPVHIKYDTVITLWDNYAKETLDDEDTKEVLDLLREELCLPEEMQPLWYFEHP